MKITVFQSDKGDSLLLTGDDGRVLLADGGMRGSYADHVAPTLGEMADEEKNGISHRARALQKLGEWLSESH